MKGREKPALHKQRISESRKRFFEENPDRREECGKRFIKHGLCRRAKGEPTPVRYRMWEHAKKRAAKAGIPFDIEPTDVVIPEMCPLLGTPLTAGTRKAHANSPSLDRIIPSLGYVKGNVWVISYRANAIKNDASVEELEMIASNLRRLTETNTK